MRNGFRKIWLFLLQNYARFLNLYKFVFKALRMESIFKSKVFYFIRNFVRYFGPNFLLRIRLQCILKKIDKRPDRAYILDCVNYYNKLEQPFRLGSESGSLKEHRYFKKPRIQSAYFFDSFEFTRWFPQKLHWNHVFGDVTFVPERPSIVKSRPIGDHNANSVVLNLDKFRHFRFVNDKLEFREKSDRLICMGDMSNKPNRLKFLEMFFDHPDCYCGDVSRRPSVPAEWQREKVSVEDHLQYKFIAALEGIDVATNLKWVMSSNSLAVMPRPKYETWFREGQLIPNVHDMEVKDDYSDLLDKMQYYIEHPEEAEKIIQNAHAYVQQFMNPQREKLISLLVLDKYFRLERTEQYP